jgi:nucleotide-binding universal stress UspA family protein
MKNIIVPIDFSDESIKGLKAALLFAQQQHTNIQLVYVKKKSGDYRSTSFEDEKIFAERKLKGLITQYSGQLKNDSTMRYIIKKGKIFEEVVSQAESYKDSIIAMSTHGASGFEELFIGSNAFKIIESTDLPVITVNKGDCPETIKRIVLPIDISPKTRQKVSYTAELARIFGAEIHVVAVTTTLGKKITQRLDAYTSQVAGYLKTLKLKVEHDSLHGDNLTDIIIDYAEKVNADLISIMNDSVSSFNPFAGTYPHQMINRSPILVLNITPKALGHSSSFSTFGG